MSETQCILTETDQLCQIPENCLLISHYAGLKLNLLVFYIKFFLQIISQNECIFYKIL